MFVAAHTHDLWLHGGKRLQRTEVGGCLHQHTATGVDQHLGHQVQTLLRAGGDQDLLRIYRPGQAGCHHLYQRAETFAGGVLQRCLGVIAQYRGTGASKLGYRKGLGRWQATGKTDDAGLFGNLENFTNHRRVHAFGAPGEFPGVGGGGSLHFSLGSGHAGRPRLQMLFMASFMESLSPMQWVHDTRVRNWRRRWQAQMSPAFSCQ